MKYEWDSTKNDTNIEKHGLGFSDAILVFTDESALYEIDNRKDYGEIRINIIGKVLSYVICMTFTERDSKRRIISARIAHRNERMHYENRTD